MSQSFTEIDIQKTRKKQKISYTEKAGEMSLKSCLFALGLMIFGFFPKRS